MEKIFAKFWERKEESYLTLSVKLHEQNEEAIEKIHSIQKRIIDNFRRTIIFYNPYNSKGLFQYAFDRFHFSLINFFTFHYNFEKFKELVRKDRNYKEIQKIIIKIINKNLPSETKAEIKTLYNGGGSVIDSFTLQIFPLEKFLNKLSVLENKLNEINENLINDFCKNYKCDKIFEIKAYSKNNSQYFPINILRFINSKDEEYLREIIGDDMDKINDIVTEVNNELSSNPLRLNIHKINLLESDPFLYKWEKIKGFNLVRQ